MSKEQRNNLLIVIASALLAYAGIASAEDKPSVEQSTIKSARTNKNSALVRKPVDINSASKEALKKLPGVDDATAEKIVAGRPYLTKAALLTHNIVSDTTYESIKRLVVAKQKPEYLEKAIAKKQQEEARARPSK